MAHPPIRTLPLRRLILALSALAISVPVTLAAASPLNLFSGDSVRGSGSFKVQNRALGHFTGMSLALPAEVELRLGSSESISIDTDDNLLALVDTVIENGTLQIRSSKRNQNLETRHLKIVVQARDIDHLDLGGSGSISADKLHAPKLQFDIGGSGTMNVKAIDGQAVTIALGGSGKFKGGGSAGTLNVSLGGSGDVQAGNLKSTSVNVTLAGSGKATVWAKDSLTLSVAGSGDVNYYGDPALSKSIAGSGSVKRLGAAPPR